MSAKYALVIGNSQYNDPRFAGLITPSGDAAALGKVLKSPDIGGFDEVFTLLDQSETVLRREIARFFGGRRKKDDLLLLYFSGHGVRDEWGRLYFAVKDSDNEVLAATAIQDNFIHQAMNDSRSQRQVLVLDCCHSGAFGRGSKGAPGESVGTASRFDIAGYGRVVLTASDATQYAWEGDQVRGAGHTSMFTRFLVQGLQTGEADADGDGQITLDEWYDHAYRGVIEATPKQKPQKFADRQQGQMVIARSPRGRTRPGDLPQELREALVSPISFVRYGAVDELGRLLSSGDESLALAARLELEHLVDDDSRRVSRAAAGLLGDRQPIIVDKPPTSVDHSPSVDRSISSEITLPLAPGVDLTLVRIPAGEFLMGSSDQDKDAYDDEKPQHSLHMEGYWIGKHPVTVAQFAAFAEASGHLTTAEQEGSGWAFNRSKKEWEDIKGADWRHPGGPGTDVKAKAGHPVTQVSWDDALAFCRWSSQVTRREIRLPSEAEWEKAARGTDGRLYPWVDEAPDNRRCNFKMNVGDTTPVGKYSPAGDSPYDCADMAGNVWEWTSSRWGDNINTPDFGYPYVPSDGRENLDSRDRRVLRGGSFYLYQKYVRCAFRNRDLPSLRYENLGFRVASSPI